MLNRNQGTATVAWSSDDAQDQWLEDQEHRDYMAEEAYYHEAAARDRSAIAAPAVDAHGNDVWGLWASLPGRHDAEVTVTTDSAINRSAIGNFLLDEGFTVYAD